MILNIITNFIIGVLGGKTNGRQPFVTAEELKTMVDVGHEEGVLEIEERKMLHNVFEFGDSQVKEVMVPRTEIIAVDVKASYDEVYQLFKDEQYSRIPVYEDEIDNIIGILNVKDILFLDREKDGFNIENSIRKPFYTFENKRIAELFEDMRKRRIQIAVVADEYGGTAGIVTMQDLVEEIFGDIDDEYDEVEHEIQRIGEGEYIVDGLTRIDLVNEVLERNFESEYYETIGGYITGVIGRFPKKGETIEFGALKCIILDAHRNRIERIRIQVADNDMK